MSPPFRRSKQIAPGTIGITALYDPELDGVPAEKGRAAVPPRSDGSLAERYWLTYVDFLTADSLALATTGSDARETVKSRPALFDASGMRVEQFFATSKEAALDAVLDDLRVYLAVTRHAEDEGGPPAGSPPAASA